jgi:adenylate cyclase class 2
VIESELKIPVAGLEPVRRRLEAAGATCLRRPELEINILFDTEDGVLVGRGQVLRVRQIGGRAMLTFKGPATWNGAVKQRPEHEVEVTSREIMTELLGALGYTPWMRYEKQRESWLLGAVRVELDHTPIGDFVELEGPPGELEASARSLDLDPALAVAESYVGLWQAHREGHPELGRDMVFDP